MTDHADGVVVLCGPSILVLDTGDSADAREYGKRYGCWW